LGNLAPEAEAVGPGVVADEVERDAREPCDGAAVATELIASGPGAEEGLLGQRLGDIAVAQRPEQKAKDPLRVELVKRFDVGHRRWHGLIHCAGLDGCRIDECCRHLFFMLTSQGLTPPVWWGLQASRFFVGEAGMLLASMNTVKAIYPGTFDPLTNGHLDLIARGSKIVDELVVAILRNSEKGTPLFSVPERLEMLTEAVSVFPNVTVTTFDGLLVEFAKREGAKAVLRGIRAISDYEYEFQMAMMNRKLDPDLETLFMMPAEKYTYVSSRLIKGVFRLGGDVTSLVPPMVMERLRAKGI